MSRRFTGGTPAGGPLYVDGGYLSSATVPVTAFPFSIGLWAVAADAGLFNPLVAFSDEGNANDACIISVDGDALTLRFASGGAVGTATHAVSDGEPHFVMLVCESATHKCLYADGDLVALITDNLTFPATFDRYYIGAEYRAARFTAHDATIALPTVWNVALTAGEVQRHAAGVFPLSIRSASVVACHGLYRAGSPEVDMIGTNDLTVAGTGTSATGASGPTISYDLPTFITQYKIGGDMADRKIIATLTGTVSSTALTLSTFSTGFSTANQAEAKGILVSTITGDVMVSCAPSYTPTASNGHPVVADGPAFPIEVSRGEGFATNFRVIRRTVDATVTISLLA